MAEIVTIERQAYTKRDPLGAPGLSIVTFGMGNALPGASQPHLG
jgi:hypothetical protein